MVTYERRRFLLHLAIVVLVAALLPLWFRTYFVHVYTIGFYYVMLAVSWNLLSGFTGQFTLATHAFASIGGYTSALLVIHSGIPMAAGVLAGACVAGGVGWLLGMLTLRMRAIYLALATWAFAESYRLFITSEYEYTRGDLGLSTPIFFGTPQPPALLLPPAVHDGESCSGSSTRSSSRASASTCGRSATTRRRRRAWA